MHQVEGFFSRGIAWTFAKATDHKSLNPALTAAKPPASSNLDGNICIMISFKAQASALDAALNPSGCLTRFARLLAAIGQAKEEPHYWGSTCHRTEIAAFCHCRVCEERQSSRSFISRF